MPSLSKLAVKLIAESKSAPFANVVQRLLEQKTDDALSTFKFEFSSEDFSKRLNESTIVLHGIRLSGILLGYLECALWAETDDNGEPFDKNYDLRDISREAVNTARKDCEKFERENAADIELSGLDDEQVGHNFWLTRNGHGTGFWDRGYGLDKETQDALKRLTTASKRFGEAYLYLDMDGNIHLNESRIQVKEDVIDSLREIVTSGRTSTMVFQDCGGMAITPEFASQVWNGFDAIKEPSTRGELIRLMSLSAQSFMNVAGALTTGQAVGDPIENANKAAAEKALKSLKEAKEYYSIIFMHDYDDETVKKFLDGDGVDEDEMIEYLSQWDGGHESETSMNTYPYQPHGKNDRTYRKGKYTLSWNVGLGYVGLTRES